MPAFLLNNYLSLPTFNKQPNTRMKKILFVLLVIATACGSDDGEPQVSRTLLQIELSSDAIADGNRWFYSLKGEGGVQLNSGELFNSDQLMIEDAEYTGETIAATIYQYFGDADRFTVSSYLEIPEGKVLTLTGNTFKVSDISAEVSFENLPESFDQVVISGQNTVADIIPGVLFDGEVFDFPFYEQAPLTLFSTIPNFGRAEYQADTLNPDQPTVVDFNFNIPMENSHVVVPDVPNLVFEVNRISLSGAQVTPDGEGFYRIYNTYDFGSTQGPFTLYSPQIFSKFLTTAILVTDEANYIQSTIGNIPSTINIIDPEIITNNTNFESRELSFSEVDQISYTTSKWVNGNSLFWIVNSPAVSTHDYDIHVAPMELSNEFSQLNQTGNLELSSVRATQLNNQTYEESLDDLFLIDRGAEKTELYKQISF